MLTPVPVPVKETSCHPNINHQVPYSYVRDVLPAQPYGPRENPSDMPWGSWGCYPFLLDVVDIDSLLSIPTSFPSRATRLVF